MGCAHSNHPTPGSLYPLMAQAGNFAVVRNLANEGIVLLSFVLEYKVSQMPTQRHSSWVLRVFQVSPVL